MNEKRLALAARRGFRRWQAFCDESLPPDASPRDLSDAVLGKLIQPGDEIQGIIYEFVKEVKGLESGKEFHQLTSPEKMEVMDAGLFLVDQLRFEAMYRLGWVKELPTLKVPLAKLVARFPDEYGKLKHSTPELAPDHPLYPRYRETFEGDRGGFVRKLVPGVLEAFGAGKRGK